MGLSGSEVWVTNSALKYWPGSSGEKLANVLSEKYRLYIKKCTRSNISLREVVALNLPEARKKS